MRDITYFRIPLHDDGSNSPELLQLAIDAALSSHNSKTKTLIVCSQSMSRSPSITSFALALDSKSDPQTLLTQYTQSAPHDISPALWNSLTETFAHKQPSA